MADHTLWHVCGICLVVLLVAIQRRARSSGILVLALWNLAGVTLHEISHLLAGILLGARPGGFSLLPHRDGRYWRLGRVSFGRITAFNAVPVALAPLGLTLPAYWIARHWSDWYGDSPAATLTLYAVLYFMLYNALPSRQDLRVACNPGSILLYSLLALGTWYLTSAAPFR